MSRDEQRKKLAALVQQAKDAGIHVRWFDEEIVVLGLRPEQPDAGEDPEPAATGSAH